MGWNLRLLLALIWIKWFFENISDATNLYLILLILSFSRKQDSSLPKVSFTKRNGTYWIGQRRCNAFSESGVVFVRVVWFIDLSSLLTLRERMLCLFLDGLKMQKELRRPNWKVWVVQVFSYHIWISELLNKLLLYSSSQIEDIRIALFFSSTLEFWMWENRRENFASTLSIFEPLHLASLQTWVINQQQKK